MKISCSHCVDSWDNIPVNLPITERCELAGPRNTLVGFYNVTFCNFLYIGVLRYSSYFSSCIYFKSNL